MLPKDRLQLAIDIQSRSYQLLKWLAKAIDREFIPVSRVHEYTNVVDLAKDWMTEHYLNFPNDIRPDRKHVREFANFFVTYLTTSFDILENPGTIKRSNCGCYCPLCTYVVSAPHLRIKRVLQRDKERAVLLMEYRLNALAKEEGIDLDSKVMSKIMNEPALRKLAAYSTYGYWLIQRLDGFSDGISLLALWREIAWTRTGSPIKNFKLQLADFSKAEKALIREIQVEHKA